MGILISGDSHTPTCGAVGMVAIGVGGLEIAVEAGYPFPAPNIIITFKIGSGEGYEKNRAVCA